jgi:arylamine N-acetyltransferase
VERLPDDLARAYLGRLGVDVGPGEVGAATLAELQRAHVACFPWETLDIVRGAPPGLDPLDTVRRLLAGRGGYCYHLNGAFAALLAWLDVDVSRHLAGVQRRADAEPRRADGNHMALTARVDGAAWLVEVGLGDGPSAPLPLIAGPHEQGGFAYGLRPSSCTERGWRFEHDPRGGCTGFDIDTRTAETAAFTAMHTILSTESVFSRVAIVQRRIGERVEVLRGCVYTELDDAHAHTRDVTTAAEWWELVLGHFRLAYEDLDSGERASLWRRVAAAHVAWDAGGRP